MKPLIVSLALILISTVCRAQDAPAYRLVTGIRAAALQREMQEAADHGFRFAAVSGDATTSAGKQVVVVMHKDALPASTREYRVVATTGDSDANELQQAADAGFVYLAQTVFTGPGHFREVAVLLERDPATRPARFRYRVLATRRISTMQRELQQATDDGYEIAGLTVGSSFIGLNDIVAVLQKTAAE
jgi:hypothetical protein